ncbi:MAG: HAMP domain-containing histidine kinase, partial [Candidatus Omnitrophota bacterium]
GKGIAQDKIDKIFDKYYHIKESSKDGVGLGLAIVKEITLLHKGRIDVFSQPGKETRFCLLLPRNLRTKEKKLHTR